MAKKIKDYSLDYYKLSKTNLPKEFVKRMIDLTDMYAEKVPRKYRTQKYFREMFYSKYTTQATRAVMIDAAVHFNPNRPTYRLGRNADIKKHLGEGKIMISWETTASGLPRNFYIKFINSKTLQMTKLKATPEIQRHLKRGHVDPASAKLAKQALNKKIDTARGLKMQAAMLEMMKLVMMIKEHLEFTITLHDVKKKYNPSPTGTDAFGKPTYSVKTFTNYTVILTPEGKYKVVEVPEDDPIHEEEERLFATGGLDDHSQHYINEGEKFREFMWIADSENEWNIVKSGYEQIGNYAKQYGNKTYDREESLIHSEKLSDLCAKNLENVINFADSLAKARFDIGKGRKRLRKLPPSRKIPLAVAHKTEAYWRIPDKKLFIAQYSKKISKVKSKIEKWKLKSEIKSILDNG